MSAQDLYTTRIFGVVHHRFDFSVRESDGSHTPHGTIWVGDRFNDPSLVAADAFEHAQRIQRVEGKPVTITGDGFTVS